MSRDTKDTQRKERGAPASEPTMFHTGRASCRWLGGSCWAGPGWAGRGHRGGREVGEVIQETSTPPRLRQDGCLGKGALKAPCFTQGRTLV